MNIMRKFLVGPPRPITVVAPPQNAQHAALGLMHLKKLFAEYSHPQVSLSQKEQEDHLYNMLPLFCRVFGSCPAKDVSEKFGDVLAFCQQVSKLMVSEIRRRASNQSTEAASWAIVKFLEIESTEESSHGWMLLSTINLLASGDETLIEVITAASLPSTLVKCLYLFFDLPKSEEMNKQQQQPQQHSEFTAEERRILLQKIFVQVLIRLSTHSAPAEELARKDDLTLLFSAITSWCPPHNVAWRKSAAEVLMTLSRHGLTPPVVNYIHNKGCVALCVDNMQRVQELSPLEIVDMFVTVFCFLKDSAEVSQTLLDDFRACQGYVFLSEFLLRLEQNKSEEAKEALRNLVFLVASLTTCGFVELKPSQASTGNLFQIAGFHLPYPSDRGTSVRNVQSFQVLQCVFLKASSSHLCNIILDAISGIYNSDNANYFILESQNTLPQFAEKIHTKTPEIQRKFLDLQEFIVFHLKFVPCKELISLSILLKVQSSLDFSVTCMQTLLKFLRHDAIFKDVYREVGLLEVMVACLHRYAGLLKESQSGIPEESGVDEGVSESMAGQSEILGSLVMEALANLLNNNTNNASVFRECGGARCAHNMVPYPTCRQQALNIVQQLVLCNGGDDDMGTLLAMMHTAPVAALELKSHILKALLFVLRESHRTRTVFRKVGGFVYVMSVLVSMEGCLSTPPKLPWNTIDQKQILGLLRKVLKTLTVAMRFEPANAKYFAQEICYTSLSDSIRLLGSFYHTTELKHVINFVPVEDETFHAIFIGNKNAKETVSRQLFMVTIMLRMLYDMALDAFDRPEFFLHFIPISPSLKHIRSESADKSPSLIRKSNMPALNFTPTAPDPIIVYPDVVVGILHLLPSIVDDKPSQMGFTLQLYIAEVLRSLMRSERNQQVMCEVGMPGKLLEFCQPALEDENHFLHPPLQYIFERLAAQALEAKDLRNFLRLGQPLCCQCPDEICEDAKKDGGGPVLLTRVKTLVSMTTPRDFRMNGSALVPPFVEFDMNMEGFGSLYLPTIAPQNASGPSVVGSGMVRSADLSVVGGIGSGDRIFPPQTGLSYSTWICVEKFSNPSVDPHCVRLLSLVRHMSTREDHLICLSVLLSARDKALIISSQETVFPQQGLADWEPEALGDGCARIWCPELLQESQWHHVAIVLSRAVLKNSSVTVYVNGQLVCSQKLHYISQNPGGGAANLTVAASVYGYIGTPPVWRKHSKLVWKQGPCLLLEEILSAHTIDLLYRLGPTYTGCLQASQLHGTDVTGPLLLEERVIFGLNALAMTQLTMAKMRKLYSKTDSKSVAKQLGMSSHENSTAIRILHNSAGHFTGAGRCLGGVVVGYQGVRTFIPKPVAKVLENVGGSPVLLGLIAMAKDIEGLYASVKALVCVVRSNTAAQLEMDRIRGYQTLAMLLKKKRLLLNSHILHLMFSLVGTVDSGRETTTIPNPTAFQDLLGDLEVWRDAPMEVQRSLYEHFYELVTESSDHKNNLFIMQELGLVSKLLHVLKEFGLPSVTIDVLSKLLSSLLYNTPVTQDVLRFGQFIAATLPSHVLNEKNINLNENETSEVDSAHDGSSEMLRQNILLRNRCLGLFLEILSRTSKVFCEEVFRILGFDWMLLFLQGHLHPTTTVLALRCLVLALSNPFLLQKFRDGSSNGGWLRDTEQIIENRMGVVLGFNVGMTCNRVPCPREIREEAYHIPGFQLLQWLMPQHIRLTEAYFFILSVLIGRHPSAGNIPTHLQLNLDSIWTYTFGVPASQSTSLTSTKLEICSDAIVTLLAMIRTLLNEISDDDTMLCRDDYAVTLVQFLYFLYKESPEFQSVCMLSEVLSALASALFPYDDSANDDTKNIQQAEMEERNLRDSLIDHPSKKIIMDFLRVIVVDSLSLPVTSKMSTVVDLILESTPERTSRKQQIAFQNKLMTSVMDHLLAADILLGEQSALILTSGGSHSYIPANVFYLIGRIVDKMWQGIIILDPHKVFDFIIKLITQAKRRTNISLDAVHHSLNRTILYQLSRPTDTVSAQMSVLEALHKLTSNRALIFGSGNYELEFIACLCYCLLHLSDNETISTDRQTVWHVSHHTASPENLQEGQDLISSAAKKVWDELYICKKPVIEEAFKVVLPTQNKTPDLTIIRDMVFETASKMWICYAEGERKSNSKTSWELHSQLQSKIQKVTGGLSRLASRKSRKEEIVRVRWVNVSYDEMLNWTFAHIATVKDLVELQYKRAQQSHHHMQKYLFEEWLQAECELTRERGLWGPMTNLPLAKWMLDMTEGPCRMRRKMMTNHLFYFHYPFRPEVCGDNRTLKFKVATSRDSKEYFLNHRSFSMVEREFLPIENSLFVLEDSVMDTSDDSVQSCPNLNRSVTTDVDEDMESADLDLEQEQSDKPDNQTVLRLLEAGEKISHMFRCARIQGLDTSEGLLLFGKEHFYVVDGFTLLKTREIRDIDFLPPKMHDPIVPIATNYTTTKQESKKICSKFAYEDIREVHKRRYLLQPIALEVFSADGRNYLLAFPRGMRNKIYQRFLVVATAINDNAQESVAGQKRTASVEQSASLLSSLIGETSVTQRWVRGEISNFQYLMHLNTLAGRSYNDLMQYPVFPWILADYTSEELDLKNSETFRDFSKPMGAQSPERLKQFQKRYKEWDDPHGETPPYHYGTHYSSAMIVASYLVRMEPFTQHFLKLQGGHFDLADRMFHSIQEAWLSASKHNMADVKELIPEFFYLPEFLVNSNNFDLGCKQNGVCLGDVILPPWAKNDPREFIRVHRLALECDYVSAHLHEWIDLIFGYKQHGAAALEAVNVFHHLFYEGNVDIYNIDDPLKKNATIGFINNFGQIPKQLFKKMHPAKKLNQRAMTEQNSSPGLNFGGDRLFFHNLDNLKPTLHPVKELKSPVGQIVCNDKMLQCVEQNKVLIPPTGTRYISWSFADQTLRVGNYESDKASFVCEVMQCGEILCCICPSSRFVITAGTSTVVSVWELNRKKLHLKQNLYGHTEAVVSLAASLAYNVIVSGSKDCSCILWDMSRLIFVRQLKLHLAPVTAVAINELTGDIATCSGTLLHLWTINGEEVASVDTSTGHTERKQQILCVAFSQLNEWDPLNVIMTGSSDGVVRMWSTVFVQIPVQTLPCDTVPENDNDNEIETNTGNREESTEIKVQNYVRKMSLVTPKEEEEQYTILQTAAALGKSGSESSLSDDEDKEQSDSTWTKVDIDRTNQKLVCTTQTEKFGKESDDEEGNEKTDDNNGGVKMRENNNVRNFNIHRSSTVTSPRTTRNGKLPVLRPSKSETSLSERLILQKQNGKKKEMTLDQHQNQMDNRLQSGFRWQCQLVFRSKLTMHTAFDRKDNAEPAAITALAVSKDHKSLYVGDYRGRVFCWSVTQQPGRVMADHWVKDEGADSCIACNAKFTFSERRHHCRNCGQLFCSRCSRFESEISRLRILKPVRVCQSCYAILKNNSPET